MLFNLEIIFYYFEILVDSSSFLCCTLVKFFDHLFLYEHTWLFKPCHGEIVGNFTIKSFMTDLLSHFVFSPHIRILH